MRVVYEHRGLPIKIVGVNDAHKDYGPKILAYLLNFDSVYRNFRGFRVGVDDVPVESDTTRITFHGGRESIGSIRFPDAKNGREIKIPVFRETDPQKVPYEELGVDVVYDSTGFYLVRSTAQRHIDAGARLVHLSGPPKEQKAEPGKPLEEKIKAYVMGVNDRSQDPAQSPPDLAKDPIYSGASCTTTCLATLASALHKKYSIQRGAMTTFHAFTNDQATQDGWNGALERARAAPVGYKYSTTGAARMVGEVIPELAGKLDGSSVRGSHEAVSVVDLTVELGGKPSAEDVNQFLESVADGVAGLEYKRLIGRLGFTGQTLSSSDVTGNPLSALVEGRATKGVDKNTMIKIAAHYDNVKMFTTRQAEFMIEHAIPFIESLGTNVQAKYG